MKVINVVGARPNFIKIAPLLRAQANSRKIFPMLVHTGQHYDAALSEAFFEDLSIPKPDINLEVGSGSHAVQTAEIMTRFETLLLETKPDLVLVVGDVNSTLACSITAKKLNIQVAHVEAGLRSRDRSMPEEINRLVTDSISDLLFTTSADANNNLKAEGVSPDKIHFVGNIMIDTLLFHRKGAKKLETYRNYNLRPEHYGLLTMHRPSNVDSNAMLEGRLKTLSEIAEFLPLIFPIHPRTKACIEKFGLQNYCIPYQQGETPTKGIYTCSPMGYKELLNLNMHAKLVITDSGGLQEETTVCQVPCLTIRENTERPETVSVGTNVIVGNNSQLLIEQVRKIFNGSFKTGAIPDLWDGKTAERIVAVLNQLGSAPKAPTNQ